MALAVSLSSKNHLYALPIDVIKHITDSLDWISRVRLLFQTSRSLRETIEGNNEFKDITKYYYSTVITNIIKNTLGPKQHPISKRPKLEYLSQQILENKRHFFKQLVLSCPSWKKLRSFGLQPKELYEHIKFLGIYLTKDSLIDLPGEYEESPDPLSAYTFYFSEILNKMPNALEELSLELEEEESDEEDVLLNNRDINRSFSQMKKLSLYHCPGIGDKGLSKLISDRSDLTEITLVRCGVTDQGIKNLVASCNKLEKLTLTNCWNITVQSLLDIACCPQLTLLDLFSENDQDGVGSINLMVFLEDFPNLTDLQLCFPVFCLFTEAEVKPSIKLKNLELTDKKSEMTDDDLIKFLECCPVLERLILIGFPKITPELNSVLKNNHSLMEVRIQKKEKENSWLFQT